MAVDRLKALEMHRKARGKIKIYPTMSIRNEEDLAMAYVQGSIHPAREIQADETLAYEYTGKGNRLAIVTNSTAVMGIGNMSPNAALPLIEGKCLLFKNFGDVNSIPLCLDTLDNEEIINTVRLIASNFGAIDIEDIKSPQIFTIVRRLNKILDIPVFSDNLHSSAIVVTAALSNALKVLGKKIEDVRIVILGAGSAGISTSEALLHIGAKNIITLNSTGILGENNPRMNIIQQDLSKKLNPEEVKGGLDEAISGADVFIGLSGSGTLLPEQIKKMADKSIVFALSLPEPEIQPEAAQEAGAAIVAGTQSTAINAMPTLHACAGVVRGLLDVRAKGLNKQVLFAATKALADIVDRKRICESHIMPDIFSFEVVPRIAEATAQAVIHEGLANIALPPNRVYDNTWERLFGGMMAHY